MIHKILINKIVKIDLTKIMNKIFLEEFLFKVNFN